MNYKGGEAGWGDRGKIPQNISAVYESVMLQMAKVPRRTKKEFVKNLNWNVIVVFSKRDTFSLGTTLLRYYRCYYLYFILTSKTFFSVAGSGFNYFKNFEEIQYFSNPKYKSIKNVVVCGISIFKLHLLPKTTLHIKVSKHGCKSINNHFSSNPKRIKHTLGWPLYFVNIFLHLLVPVTLLDMHVF